ncbi:hypothetical protein [Microbacterium sp. NIBRBAC000506063]|nr:hypothetical protein [Microbacterium sp. NIBRBAC000506063]
MGGVLSRCLRGEGDVQGAGPLVGSAVASTVGASSSVMVIGNSRS